jgi:hypothetical protein
VLLLALVCLALVAAPAAAQRDPFDPLIDPDAGTTVGTTGGTGTVVTPSVPQQEVGSEGLANTGTNVEPWVAIAYGLVVIGGGILMIARLQEPDTRSSR